MSGWDDSAAPTGGAAWDGGDMHDYSAAPAGDVYDGISPEHISKHDGAPDDDACRNCGIVGHYSRDCPEPRQMTGECFNCGQVGHNKADCTNEAVERPFTGTCRNCGVEGHRSADCPDQTCKNCGQPGHRRVDCPTETCKRCGNQGHIAANCEAKYNIYPADLPEVADPDEAWRKLGEADKTGDSHDFKQAFLVYVKLAPELTFVEMEVGFRDQGFKNHIIAMEQNPASEVHTNVDLQGNQDRKYKISFQPGSKPRRKIGSDAWPKTVEENMERLRNAGFAMDCMKPLCTNCKELGHVKKNCPQEPEKIERPVAQCDNCKETGHYIRDCPQPRAVRGGGECRNCGQEGHRAADCTEEPKPHGACRICDQEGHFAKDCPDKPPPMACRNCGEEGHKAADCTQERKIICRNCDEEGHVSKECTKPRDWSRVQCRLCSKFGHGAARCPEPPVPEDEPAAVEHSAIDHGAYTAAPSAGGDDWNTGAAGGDDAWGGAPAVVSAW